MIIKNNTDIRELIEVLLQYKQLKKSDIAIKMKILPQALQHKLNAKNLDLQFLTTLANITNCNLQIFYQDNKYKQKLSTKKEKLFNRINELNDKQFKLISDILDNLKN